MTDILFKRILEFTICCIEPEVNCDQIRGKQPYKLIQEIKLHPNKQHKNYEKVSFKESLSDDQPIIFPKYSELQVCTEEYALNVVLFPEGHVNKDSLPVGHQGQTEE